MPKTYLGDAVYITAGPYAGAWTLTTEDGIRATNTIVLEQEVLEALFQHVLPGPLYLELVRLARQQQKEKPDDDSVPPV